MGPPAGSGTICGLGRKRQGDRRSVIARWFERAAPEVANAQIHRRVRVPSLSCGVLRSRAKLRLVLASSQLYDEREYEYRSKDDSEQNVKHLGARLGLKIDGKLVDTSHGFAMNHLVLKMLARAAAIAALSSSSLLLVR
jgi:hypothetical protein